MISKICGIPLAGSVRALTLPDSESEVLAAVRRMCTVLSGTSTPKLLVANVSTLTLLDGVGMRVDVTKMDDVGSGEVDVDHSSR